MSTNADILRSVPLFQGMTNHSIDTIAGLADETTFSVGDELVREGEPGDSFLVLVDGAAEVRQGGRTLRILGPGEFLGEIALIDGGPRTATVVATDEIRALRVDRDGFSKLMNEFPVIRLDLVTALTHRLRQRAPEPLD